ncbi:hypothetical protein [Dolosigranulum savutiense]|uniref:Uncharacterized protein n=1 Tax=Dolosigranulum savutiense TaxID=3110288 RepID=A0AB74U783_9LACT
MENKKGCLGCLGCSGCLGTIFTIIVILVGISPFTSNSDNTKEAPPAEDVATEQVVEETEEVTNEASYEDINNEIAEYMEENRGYALGTLGSDGNPTEDGEPNYNFAWALFVQKLEYRGNDLLLQTDDGFLELTEEERLEVANNAQSIAGFVIGRHEDWSPEDHQRGIFTTIQSGDRVIGSSKALNLREFTWHE